MRKGLVFVIAAAAVLLTTSVRGDPCRRRAGRRLGAGGAGGRPALPTIALPTDPGALDPHMTLVGAARYVDAFAYDTLVNLVGPGTSRPGSPSGGRSSPRRRSSSR